MRPPIAPIDYGLTTAAGSCDGEEDEGGEEWDGDFFAGEGDPVTLAVGYRLRALGLVEVAPAAKGALGKRKARGGKLRA